MTEKETGKEIATIIIAALVLAISISLTDLNNLNLFYTALVSFLIIIISNILVKKIFAYHFEINIKTKLWSIYQYGLKKSEHFKKPIPSFWIPLLASFISRGYFLWLGILEFDATPRPERASRRHGLYRFTEVTERHLGYMAFFGLLANIILGIIGYIAGFEIFARLSIYYAMWSIIPISKLDGTKITFANRGLWILSFAVTSILLVLSFLII